MQARKKVILCLVAMLTIFMMACGLKESADSESSTQADTPQSEEVKMIETQTEETESEQPKTSETKEEIQSETEQLNLTWKITQFGPVDDNMSFYTIYNKDAGLIVVDGGWTNCAAHVRNTIKTLGGHVDAWILTHPHADHVGAFNAIYPNPDGITIGDIYTVDMASPEECLEAASWDSMDAYNDFLALEVQGLQYVKAGDVFDICGLKFEILSTFDEEVRSLSDDYLNDGSVMFKVYGAEETFLFCADVGEGVSDHLLGKYGEEKLMSTYLQMGHHGNGGLSAAFYQTVNPKAAFFDAPDWLLKDETGKYDTPENVALMESMGSRIYGFNSAPNSVYIK